ncbi:MAG TPA: hypothetical protein VNA15_10410 [Candidatus Angelobacter sp.]|nr:hypothetical protein [Candidatus Angelobacter sp.]
MKQRLRNLAKSRWFLPTLLMIISLSVVAYAAVTSIPVSNTITITTGANIQVIYQTTAFASTTCPTTGYTTSPTGVSFSEPAGGAANAYLCINNIGSGSDTPTISITGGNPANCGAAGTSPCFAISPTSLATIPLNGFSPPTTLNITNSYATAQSSPVAITITIT